MFKASFKNFFKSLGFYFVPLGIMAFFVIIAIANLIPQAISIAQNTFQQIATYFGSTTYDWNEVSGLLLAKIAELSSDPEALIGLANDPASAANIIADIVKEVFGVETISSDISTIIQDGLTQMAGLLIGFIAIFIVSFFVGFVVLKFLLRKFLTDTSYIRALLTSILDGVIISLLMVLILFLLGRNNQVLFWVAVVIATIGTLLISLLEAYLFYGIRRVKFTKVFNIKNIFALLLCDLIDLALLAGIIALCFLIPNRFNGIFIMIPFVELIICIIGLNAESYASEMAKRNKIEEKVISNIEKKEV